MRWLCSALCVLSVASSLLANERGAAGARAAREHVRKHDAAIIAELQSFVSIPNLASDREGIDKNAAAIVAMFKQRGIEARLLRLDNVPPLVVAEWGPSIAPETIAFYAHYDGQPVDASQWSTPPWQAVIRGDRMYGRSVSDDKAPIVAMLAAIDAMRAAKLEPKSRILFVFEGEEEAGSPNLAQYLAKFDADLSPDAWMICDGPVHQSRRMQLYFGVRGVTGLDITLYGPARPLHSGHYGNWAPNPIVTLTDLLASMRDTSGRITIPGFHAEVVPISEGEKRALAEVPAVEAELKKELQLGRTEGDGRPLAELILAPAMNVRGIQSGAVGAKAANAIPTEARASIDFRLVPAQTPESVKAHVERFIASRGFHIVRETPEAATRMAHPNVAKLEWGSGYPASRTAVDSPIGQRVSAAVAAASGSAPIRMPTLGGSVPIHLFTRGGRIPALGVPIVNHDSNQHAANENLRLENLRDGVAIFAALFAGL